MKYTTESYGFIDFNDVSDEFHPHRAYAVTLSGPDDVFIAYYSPDWDSVLISSDDDETTDARHENRSIAACCYFSVILK